MNIPRFRAWDKVNKKMISSEKIAGIDFENECIGYREKKNGKTITFFPKLNEVELMQSTGLFDKNGKEIFEGDIIKLDVNDCGKIIIAAIKHGEYFYSSDGEYNCKRYGWYINHEWSGYTRNTGYCLNAYKGGCEVIGNIYENPELLKGVEE